MIRSGRIEWKDHVAHGRNEKCIQAMARKPEGKRHYLVVNWRIILKYNVNRMGTCEIN
jgi:hypothetical protein